MGIGVFEFLFILVIGLVILIPIALIIRKFGNKKSKNIKVNEKEKW